NPLVFTGKQFARTIRAFVNFHGLLHDGLALLIQVRSEYMTDSQLNRDREDWFCLKVLFKLTPTLEDRLVASNKDKLIQIAELVSTCYFSSTA
ncbi:hypothetical protein FA15DRAFT_607277, partial [Coprinopsis marcescibilis]